ncbi:MAG: hypothetical protein M1368_02180 [Thaumarchaeota archaeon]|nr:hypothetical protein [Nitrososphaerota archaeon]
MLSSDRHNVLYQKFHKEPWYENIASYASDRYFAIEDRMINVLRYVDLDPRNSAVFSYEFESLG